MAVAIAGAKGRRDWGLETQAGGAGGAWLAGHAQGAVGRRVHRQSALGCPPAARNCVRLLRLLRATVQAAAWSAGPRTLGTRMEAGARERRGLGSRAIRIGCASAFWGDTAASVPQLIYGEKLDFLVFHYLSEVTLCLLTAAKGKSPDLGYVPDFLQTAMTPYIRDIHKKGVRVTSNAGGTNPLVCAAALDQMARKAGVDLNIAVVTGDDVMREKEALQGSAITDIESGKKFPDTMRSMSVYLGARPISRALDLGADVVLTGRCVDSAVVLGPLIHAFGWKSNDFDLLAADSLMGHLVECGAQSTGRVFTNWHLVPDWHSIGFPVLECFPDGQFIPSKPPGTGGLVSFSTVAEQLLYEVGNPQQFLFPDVTCDFSQVSITEIPGIEGGAVRVQGAKGSPPSSFYKRMFRKLTRCAQGQNGKWLPRSQALYCLPGLVSGGSEETYGTQAKAHLNRSPGEVVLWLSVHHKEKKVVEIFSREIASAGTGMAPGLMGVVGGRPKVSYSRSPVLKPFFFLYPKQKVKVDIHLINGGHIETFREDLTFTLDSLASPNLPKVDDDLKGIIARHPVYYPYLKKFLTAQAIEDFFQHILHKEQPEGNSVIRYELPGIYALNFILKNSLGGGGTASLRSDPQGKALGQMVLDFQIKDVPDLKALVGS